MKTPLLPPTPQRTEEEAQEQARRNRHTAPGRFSLKFRDIVLGGVLVLILAAYFIRGFSRPIPFNATTWKTAPLATRLGLREQMVHDLVNSHRLIGMNLTQVLNLLGSPDDPPVAQKSVGYKVGHGHLWLILELDAQQRVSSAQIGDFS